MSDELFETPTEQTPTAMGVDVPNEELFPDEETATDVEPTETTEATEAKDPERPAWLAEKFKDGEHLANSYKELEAKYREKHEVPESYAYEDTGLQLRDEAQWNEVQNQFKELGISQKQASAVMKLGSGWVNQLLNEMGPKYDLAAERQALIKEYGSEQEAASNYNANKKWAVANDLPKSIMQSQSFKTAEVQTWISKLRNEQRGPNPITTNAVTKGPSQEDIWAVLNDPEYYQMSAKGDALRRRHDELVRQMQKK